MASNHSAARPKREGETFARTHHHDTADSDPKRVRFDVRNPSTLAPDAREEDAVLDADVIGGSNATKRGAVNLDGYDSDSDTEDFQTKQRASKNGEVNILKQLENYDARDTGSLNKETKADANEEDDDDMFAADDDEGGAEPAETSDFDKLGKKDKGVKFMEPSQIQGEVLSSKTGGTIRLDEAESSEDEEEADLRMQEEGVDQEVGAGGLKKHAPKVEAFNLKEEMEDGQFDQDGNYIRKAGDPDAVHDNWLEGVSKKEMKKAAEAHEKREAAARSKRIQEDGVMVSELLKTLILQLQKTETPLEALARLGKNQTKPKKQVPKWKLKKMRKQTEGSGDTMMDDGGDSAQDAEQGRIKEAINAITDAADKLLSRNFEEVYEQERELLVREYQRDTGEEWVEPDSRDLSNEDSNEAASTADEKQWSFRWTDGRDGGAVQGPFEGSMMKAWQDAGYFGEAVEFREAGADQNGWTKEVAFA